MFGQGLFGRILQKRFFFPTYAQNVSKRAFCNGFYARLWDVFIVFDKFSAKMHGKNFSVSPSSTLDRVGYDLPYFFFFFFFFFFFYIVFLIVNFKIISNLQYVRHKGKSCRSRFFFFFFFFFTSLSRLFQLL